MKRSRNFIVIAGLIGVVAAIIVFTGLSSKGTQNNRAVSVMTPVPVEITPVSLSKITETVSAVGTIAAMRDEMISSETAGRVTNVNVKVGDFVRAGQTLVVVDDELKEIAVEQAKAQLLAAQTSFNKAQKDFQRAQKLYAANDIADVELEGDRLAMQAAEAQYKSALVGLKFAERQYDDTRIKARISGFVASKKVEVGEMVSPGKEIANVVDMSNVKVKLSIPEEDIVKLQLKQPAVVRIDADPSIEFKGVVYSIGAKSESANGHSYPVEILVENKNAGIIKAGMFAHVDIETQSAHGALVISKESLVNDEENPAVFVAENKIAKLRPVTLGLQSGNEVQVVSGLQRGDLVISFGQKKLKDGSSVQFGQQ